MQKRLMVGIITGAALVGLAACSSSTAPSLLSDAQVTADVATTSGEAAATDVSNMIGSETGAAFPGAPAGGASAIDTNSLSVQRTVVCYDSTGAVQASCNGTTTDSVRIHLSVTGLWSDSNFNGQYTAHVHRVRDATISHLLGTETYRIHNAVGTSNDTTSFTGSTNSRVANESSVDSVVNIRFNLPRSSNPWPVSGQIIRNVSGTVVLTGSNQTTTKTFTRRVTVTFPADAQGNVVLTINAKTCNLNLVTRKVTACS